MSSMTDSMLVPSAKLEEMERRLETTFMLHKYGAYLSFPMFDSQTKAKVLFYPGASHNIVSSKWSKLAREEFPCLSTTIEGFQQPLYSQAICDLYFQSDDNVSILVRAQVVDEIQDGIDVVFGYPFEELIRICKIERKADNVRFDLKRRIPHQRFHVTMEGILLPRQNMRLPLKLPAYFSMSE